MEKDRRESTRESAVGAGRTPEAGAGNDGPDRRKFLKIAALAAATGYVAPKIEIARAGSTISGVPVALPIVGFVFDRVILMRFGDPAMTTYEFAFMVTVDIDPTGALTLRDGAVSNGTLVSGNPNIGPIQLSNFVGGGTYDTATADLNISLNGTWMSQGPPPIGAGFDLEVRGVVRTGGWSLNARIFNEPPLTSRSPSGRPIVPNSPDIVGDDINDKQSP